MVSNIKWHVIHLSNGHNYIKIRQVTKLDYIGILHSTLLNAPTSYQVNNK